MPLLAVLEQSPKKTKSKAKRSKSKSFNLREKPPENTSEESQYEAQVFDKLIMNQQISKFHLGIDSLIVMIRSLIELEEENDISIDFSKIVPSKFENHVNPKSGSYSIEAPFRLNSNPEITGKLKHQYFIKSVDNKYFSLEIKLNCNEENWLKVASQEQLKALLYIK